VFALENISSTRRAMVGLIGEPPAGGAADGGSDVFGAGCFQKVAGGSGADGAEDFVVLFEHGENDDGGLRRELSQSCDAVDAIHAWQADIEQKHLWRGFGGQRGEGIFARGEALSAGEAFDAVQGTGESLAVGFVVFDEPDVDGFRHEEAG
jgi:hypothetical protein